MTVAVGQRKGPSVLDGVPIVRSIGPDDLAAAHRRLWTTHWSQRLGIPRARALRAMLVVHACVFDLVVRRDALRCLLHLEWADTPLSLDAEPVLLLQPDEHADAWPVPVNHGTLLLLRALWVATGDEDASTVVGGEPRRLMRDVDAVLADLFHGAGVRVSLTEAQSVNFLRLIPVPDCSTDELGYLLARRGGRVTASTDLRDRLTHPRPARARLTGFLDGLADAFRTWPVCTVDPARPHGDARNGRVRGEDLRHLLHDHPEVRAEVARAAPRSPGQAPVLDTAFAVQVLETLTLSEWTDGGSTTRSAATWRAYMREVRRLAKHLAEGQVTVDHIDRHTLMALNVPDGAIPQANTIVSLIRKTCARLGMPGPKRVARPRPLRVIATVYPSAEQLISALCSFPVGLDGAPADTGLMALVAMLFSFLRVREVDQITPAHVTAITADEVLLSGVLVKGGKRVNRDVPLPLPACFGPLLPAMRAACQVGPADQRLLGRLAGSRSSVKPAAVVARLTRHLRVYGIDWRPQLSRSLLALTLAGAGEDRARISGLVLNHSLSRTAAHYIAIDLRRLHTIGARHEDRYATRASTASVAFLRDVHPQQARRYLVRTGGDVSLLSAIPRRPTRWITRHVAHDQYDHFQRGITSSKAIGHSFEPPRARAR